MPRPLWTYSGPALLPHHCTPCPSGCAKVAGAWERWLVLITWGRAAAFTTCYVLWQMAGVIQQRPDPPPHTLAARQSLKMLQS